MPSEIYYSINGKECRGDEYLELVEQVFNRTTPDVEQIELSNGEIVSLAGNDAYVTIQHIKHDGSIWIYTRGRLTKQDAKTLLRAFIQGNEEILAKYGATLSSYKSPGDTDSFEEGKIAKRTKPLFIIFFTLALFFVILWKLVSLGDIFLVFVYMSLLLAMVCYLIYGFKYLIGAYRCNIRSVGEDRSKYSSWHFAVRYCISVVGVLFVLIFGVLLPLYLIIFMASQIFRMLGNR
jgi:hypothetical protein